MPDQDTQDQFESLTHEQIVERFLKCYSVADIGQQTGGLGTDIEGHLRNEIDRLHRLLNTPLFDDFLEATKREAAHQIERWGTVHDRGKAPQDWFWLIGYLAGKAVRAHIDGDRQKALHHTISSAAALLNWHAAIKGVDNRMQPGHSDVERLVEDKFQGETAT